MTASPTPHNAMDREFLTIRGRLIELAAALDRLDRAGFATDDPRRRQIQRGIEALLPEGRSRVEQVQMEFSLPYNEHWREP
jgi:hypothetical protein